MGSPEDVIEAPTLVLQRKPQVMVDSSTKPQAIADFNLDAEIAAMQKESAVVGRGLTLTPELESQLNRSSALPPELLSQLPAPAIPPDAEVGSRLKHLRGLVDPNEISRAPMILPGWNGTPFKGKTVPFIKNDDPEHLQPRPGIEAYVWVLDMSNDKDRKDYADVCQLIANGFADISAEDRQYDSDLKSWRIFLRWVLHYHYIPKSRSPQA